MASWQDDVLALSALYLMDQRGRKFPLYPTTEEDRKAADVFQALDKVGSVAPVGNEWVITDHGRESLKRAVQAQDVLRQVEIFSSVDVTRNLTPEEADPTNPSQVRSEVWDPRFALGSPNAYDMRLAVVTWLAEVVSKKPFGFGDQAKIVFLQKLGSGQFSMTTFWADVYNVFAEVEEIVRTAYKWTDISADIEDAKVAMQALYTAGTLETQKREGGDCADCHIPLLMFDKAAKAAGSYLKACPCCNRQFGAPDDLGSPGTMSCPKCKSVIYEGDARCNGCGATIDFSLPAGAIQTDTTVTTVTEPVWGDSYGYVSYGWFNPYDPFLDVLAFDCLFYDPYYYY